MTSSPARSSSSSSPTTSRARCPGRARFDEHLGECPGCDTTSRRCARRSAPRAPPGSREQAGRCTACSRRSAAGGATAADPLASSRGGRRLRAPRGVASRGRARPRRLLRRAGDEARRNVPREHDRGSVRAFRGRGRVRTRSRWSSASIATQSTAGRERSDGDPCAQRPRDRAEERGARRSTSGSASSHATSPSRRSRASAGALRARTVAPRMTRAFCIDAFDPRLRRGCTGRLPATTTSCRGLRSSAWACN